MPLDDLKNTIVNLEKFDWGQEQETIVENNSDAIVQLQEEQLYSGEDSDGAPITLESRGYSKKTFEIKSEKGQPTDRITWKDTGALYTALDAAVNNGEVSFSAPGEEEKYNAMVDRSGERVLGLNRQRREQFAENIILPAIKSVYKQETGFEIS